MTEYIEIRGARENNLKDISLRIPKRQITIFTGVSGSGKSSIVFDTIATEAQRQLYENFSFFIRSFLPRYPQPEADAIENLSMAVIVDQKRLGGGSHSTVGHDHRHLHGAAAALLALGQPHVGYSNAFSFNDPQGMCPECNGLGRKVGVVVGRLHRSLEVAQRGRGPGPVLGRLGDRRLRGVRLLRQRQEARRLHARGDGPPPVRQGPQVQAADRRQDDERHLPRRHREARALVRPARHQDALGADPEGGRAVPPHCGRARCARAPASARPRSAHEIDGHNIAELAVDGGRRPDRRSCA